MNRAPILLLAYNRPNLLEKTLHALVNCRNSKEYSVYVHIDPPNIYKEEDIKKNADVKRVLSDFSDQFDKFIIFEEEHHLGLAQSVIKSVSEVISVSGKIIVIEDDWILSYDCLDFLNEALHYYESDKEIWSVTGYCPILDGLKDYEKSIFMTHRASSRVWATWRDRWELVDWEVKDYRDFISDYNKRLLFCRGGYDLPGALKLQMDGQTDSWGIRWAYEQNKRNALTVYPTLNRVYHIGEVDGTHVHSEFPQTKLQSLYPNYCFEINVDEALITDYQIQCGDSSAWDVCFDKRNMTIAKFENMFKVMHMWKELNENGHYISEYFINRGYHRVAIYGKGKIGKHIEVELAQAGIEMAFYIDRNEKLHDGRTCVGMKESLPACDCVVVSVVDGVNDIICQLRNVFNGDIKGIIDVLKDR